MRYVIARIPDTVEAKQPYVVIVVAQLNVQEPRAESE